MRVMYRAIRECFVNGRHRDAGEEFTEEEIKGGHKHLELVEDSVGPADELGGEGMPGQAPPVIPGKPTAKKGKPTAKKGKPEFGDL